MMRARLSRDIKKPFGDNQNECSPYVGNLPGTGGFARSVSNKPGDTK